MPFWEDRWDRVRRFARGISGTRAPTFRPTEEVAIADTRLSILNTVSLFPFNPDVLSRTKGGLEVYSKMLADEQVKAALVFKKASILGPGWDLTPRGDTPGEQDLATVLKADLLALAGTFEDDLWEILSALEYGFSLTELVWEDAGDRLKLKDLKARAPHQIDFAVDPYGNVVDIVQQQAQGRVKLPSDRFCHFLHNPTFSNPYGNSELRAAYKWWFYKASFQQTFAVYMEQLALPPKFATFPKGEDARAGKIRQILSNLQANTAVTVPEGWDVKLLETARDPEAVFIAALDRADLGIARAVLVPEKLGLAGGAVKGGSFALAHQQSDTFFLMLTQIARRLEKAVQTQIVDRMVAFSAPTVPSPQFKLLPLSDENKEAIAEIWIKAVTGGAVLAELEDENHFRELVGFPQREDDGTGTGPPGPVRAVAAPLARDGGGDQPGGGGSTPSAGIMTGTPRGARGSGVTPVVGGNFRKVMAETVLPGKAEAERLTASLPNDFWRALHPLEVRADLAEKRATYEDGTTAVSDALVAGMRALIADVATRAKRLAARGRIADVRALRAAASARHRMRAAVLAALQRVHRRAGLEATREVHRARRQALAEGAAVPVRMAAGLVGSQADAYLRARAFQVTDVLAQDVLDAAQNVLLRTFTQDKTARQIEFELDDALGDFLPETDAAGRRVNVPARLETIARTTVADAVNQARFTVFTDPALEGFVTAFRYTAVLDSRTRPHHRAWDGVTLATDDPHWYGPPDERPPNGFNCRCTLIPVTTADTATLTPDNAVPTTPAADPGFK